MDDFALAGAHQAAGRLAEAAACYRRWLAEQPDHAVGWAALGSVAFRQQDLDEAIACYRRSLAHQPADVQVLTSLGAAYAIKGDFAAAERVLREATALRPPFVEAYRNLAHVLRDQGKWVEAVEAYQQALKLRPRDDRLMNTLNDTVGRAEADYRRALAHAPQDANVHSRLGIVYAAARRFVDAEAAFRTAVELDPGFAAAQQNLGICLVELNRTTEAIAGLTQALRLCPDAVELHQTLGFALGKSGNHHEALAAYERALALNPQHLDARKNRALSKLILGQYVEGFAEYEVRWDYPGMRPDCPQPVWRGEPLAGKTILLVSEQGFGDTIQFIRYAPKVKALGATVLFNCTKPLVPLLANVPGVDAVIPEGQPLPAFDVFAPLLSLAGIFRTTVEDVAAVAPVPYLHADQRLVEQWSARLGPRVPGEVRVGLAWQGNPNYPADRFRSAPLAAFVPLAAVPGVQFISLQKHHGVEQIAPLADRLPVLELNDTGFADAAALLMLLDVLITVDSAPVHLAGALGRPTWLALSTDSDWRWLVGRDDSPWYPTVRIFRQPKLDDWHDVFTRMAQTLAEGRTTQPMAR